MLGVFFVFFRKVSVDFDLELKLYIYTYIFIKTEWGREDLNARRRNG